MPFEIETRERLELYPRSGGQIAAGRGRPDVVLGGPRGGDERADSCQSSPGLQVEEPRGPVAGDLVLSFETQRGEGEGDDGDGEQEVPKSEPIERTPEFSAPLGPRSIRPAQHSVTPQHLRCVAPESFLGLREVFLRALSFPFARPGRRRLAAMAEWQALLQVITGAHAPGPAPDGSVPASLASGRAVGHQPLDATIRLAQVENEPAAATAGGSSTGLRPARSSSSGRGWSWCRRDDAASVRGC
jgi:hypothetical protein